MTFGTATLTTPARKPKGKPRRVGPAYDCGKAGMLRATQIAEIAGITMCAVRLRVKRGVRGAALLKPAQPFQRKKDDGPRRPGLVVACKLARAFPAKVPSVAQIQKLHPMCRVSAQRWRNAWAATLEAA